jgi:hypothetical protein
MDKEFLIIDTHESKNGNVTEFKESDGKMLIRHFSGTNTDNFTIKKFNGKRLDFCFFKLNGIYYININGCHIIDYKNFIHIQHISQKEQNVSIKNPYIGEIILINCDVDIVHKALTIMSDWIKSKQTMFNDIMYFIFN